MTSEKAVLGEIYEDILIHIVQFIVNKEPSSLTKLKRINKYWFRSLDPNKPNVNIIWENNICRKMFPSIPKNLKVKRWDRYYQYKYHKVRETAGLYDNNDNIRQLWNPSNDHEITFDKFNLIEGCTNDIEAINSYHYHERVGDNNRDKDEVFMDKVDPKTGLPPGFQWKLKCPTVDANLEWIDRTTSWCEQCYKHVYLVKNIEELKERSDNGDCVQYVVDKDSNYYFTKLLELMRELESDEDRKSLFELYSKLTARWQKEAVVKKWRHKIAKKREDRRPKDGLLIGYVQQVVESPHYKEFRQLREKQRDFAKKLADPNYYPSRKECMEHAMDLEVMLAQQESLTEGMREAKQIIMDYLESTGREALLQFFKIRGLV